MHIYRWLYTRLCVHHALLVCIAIAIRLVATRVPYVDAYGIMYVSICIVMHVYTHS